MIKCHGAGCPLIAFWLATPLDDESRQVLQNSARSKCCCMYLCMYMLWALLKTSIFIQMQSSLSQKNNIKWFVLVAAIIPEAIT